MSVEQAILDPAAMPARKRGSRLAILTNFEDRFRIVADAIARAGADGRTLQILEAGCGQRWPYALPSVRYVLTGVDLDAEALRIRQDQARDLDVVIEGDLRSVRLPDAHYDVIYSGFVLEHVAQADRVLDNFARWLKPGGIVIIFIPNPATVFGFVTSHTPFWTHVLHHRWMKGNRDAGKPGFAPYPTIYDPVIREPNLLRFMHERGLALRGAWGYGRSPGILYAVTRLIGALSLGRLRTDHVNCFYIFERTGRPPEPRRMPVAAAATESTPIEATPVETAAATP